MPCFTWTVIKLKSASQNTKPTIHKNITTCTSLHQFSRIILPCTLDTSEWWVTVMTVLLWCVYDEASESTDSLSETQTQEQFGLSGNCVWQPRICLQYRVTCFHQMLCENNRAFFQTFTSISTFQIQAIKTLVLGSHCALGYRLEILKWTHLTLVRHVRGLKQTSLTICSNFTTCSSPKPLWLQYYILIHIVLSSLCKLAPVFWDWPRFIRYQALKLIFHTQLDKLQILWHPVRSEISRNL